MQARVHARRTAAIVLCALTLLAAACSSSGGHSATSNTTEPTSAAAASTDPNLTPNSIPFVVGDQIGLPNDWIVRVAAVHYPKSVAGSKAVSANERYVAIDIAMRYDGTASYTVSADKLFTLTDSSHKSHVVLAHPGASNGIDGLYAHGTARSGQLLFTAPRKQNLGLVLYGPRIGTKVSFFAIDPPTVAQQ